jgi:hypothetical protein
MLTISSQQAAHYTQNGFLELEAMLSPSECEALVSAIKQTLQKRAGNNFIHGRDLWREAPLLKSTLLSKKLSGLALAVTQKPTLRLACDQWFPPGYMLKTPEKIERLFSIQGLICTIFIQLDPGLVQPVGKTTPLGLSPFPKGQGNVLLMKPSLLLNWPQITPEMGLYCVNFCLPASVSVQNAQDPAGVNLRKLDYGYGDPLRSDTHPLVHP